MQRAAAHQAPVVGGDQEIADVFGHLEFRARQHDAAGRIGIDQIQQGRDIGEPGATYIDHGVPAILSPFTTRVPVALPAITLATTPSRDPGAMITSAPPATFDRSAVTAASSF